MNERHFWVYVGGAYLATPERNAVIQLLRSKGFCPLLKPNASGILGVFCWCQWVDRDKPRLTYDGFVAGLEFAN